MTTMTPEPLLVTGGVDTHQDLHVAAALDQLGRVLGTESFPTTVAGYRRLLAWLRRHGRIGKVGVEGTGSYGAALARHLTDAGVEVIEVSRPNRQVRRRYGKTDVVDAIAAARAVQSGEAGGQVPAPTSLATRRLRARRTTSATTVLGCPCVRAGGRHDWRLQVVKTHAWEQSLGLVVRTCAPTTDLPKGAVDDRFTE